ncbi:GNAT family N-acetyltransferase [Micromonospora sp. FIMYZ51]|uniref:GNAT family N-acetyltransferase n=1 Tax=Micromonospora sp. FIMYZ51 TaxID=3051832 RepID=UPI00311D7970
MAALAEERAGIVAGRRLSALVRTAEEGVLAGAMAMRLDDAAEIAGVATLPAARRRGLATAVTAALARALLAAGVDLVFLAAGDEEIARVYLRVGFRRVATACTAN